MNATKRAFSSEAADTVKRAAVDVITDHGLGAFSIREVARRAGLSHAAPGYFFGDSQGLLTAIAIEGFETLRQEMLSATAAENDPEERLVAIGRAYVRVAVRFPAHCEVMFRTDVVNVDDQKLETAGLLAFDELQRAVAAFAAAHNPGLDLQTASRLCWSAMQGLVQLRQRLERMDQIAALQPFDIEAEAEALSRMLIAGLAAPRNNRPKR